MAIDNIGSLDVYNLNLIDQANATKNSVSKSDNGSVFEAFLDASTKMYSETNALQKEVEVQQIAFATGETDNILDVMLAEQKASTALTFTVQVTNKVIEAYKEIMQIQL